MKKPLYYAIRRNLGNDIVAVTSEKGTSRWYGRRLPYNEVTHGTFDQLIAKGFNSEAEARDCKEGIEKIDAEFNVKIKDLQRQINELHRQCRRAIGTYIEDFYESRKNAEAIDDCSRRFGNDD